MRLVGETTRRRDLRDRFAGAEHPSGAGDPQVRLERVRSESRLVMKPSHELKASQSSE
jgi:hypothetical protein